MARSINTIYDSITSGFVKNKTINLLYGLDESKTFAEQFSPVSLEAIIFYRVAMAIRTLEELFDEHKQEVTEIIADQKVGSKRWYAYIARQFQYGDNLNPDTDEYDNTGKTEEQIAASRIIAYSAVVKRNKTVVIKVAKAVGDKLAPLSDDERKAFTAYMDRVQCAGDDLEIVSIAADKLQLKVDIYYNPLVLNSNGQRLDGESVTPIADAIKQYLKVLPFNGELVEAFLVDALQAVDGVVIPHIKGLKYRSGTQWLDVDVKYQPLSGYFTIDDAELTVNYIPQTDIV